MVKNMRNRFQKKKKSAGKFPLLFPVITFAVIVALFLIGVNQVSEHSSSEQKRSLETIIQRDVVHCYASEGSYPPSLDYLESNYGLTYDHSKFFVDYQPIGENIFPEITVFEKFDDGIMPGGGL